MPGSSPWSQTRMAAGSAKTALNAGGGRCLCCPCQMLLPTRKLSSSAVSPAKKSECDMAWQIQAAAILDSASSRWAVANSRQGSGGYRRARGGARTSVCNACIGIVSSCISPRHGTPADGARGELGLIAGPRVRDEIPTSITKAEEAGTSLARSRHLACDSGQTGQGDLMKPRVRQEAWCPRHF